MRLKLRHTMRKSKEEIEASFNPINLDSIFEEDDPLCQWVQEREEPLLDNREDNAWLHSVDTNDTDEDSNDNHGNQHQQQSQSLSSSPANTSPNDPDDSLNAPSDDDGDGGNETYVGNEEGDMEGSSSGGYAQHDNLGGDNMTNMELLSYYNRQRLPPGLPPRHGGEGSSSQGMVLGYHGAEGSSSQGMVSGYHGAEGSSSQGMVSAEGSSSQGMVSGYHGAEGSSSLGMVSGYSDTSSHDSHIFQPLNVYPPSHNYQPPPLYYPSLPTSHEYEDHSPHLHPHPSQPIHYTEEPRGEINMALLNNLFEKGWGWENKVDNSSDMGGEAMEEPARRSFWW